jgi:site-specific recombinase XerD
MKNYKDDFLSYLKNSKKYTNNTIKTYDIALSQMFEYAVFEEESSGKYILDLTMYRKMLSNQSSSTIAKKLSSIRSYIEYLNEGGIAVEMIGGENVHVVKKHFSPLSTSIIKKAIRYADLEEKIIIYLIYQYGLRISEISNLKLSNLNVDKLKIECNKNSRVLPLEFSFLKLLEVFLSQNEKNCYFFEKNEKRLSENSLRYKLSKCFERVDEKVTPQQLRYSLVVDMIDEGAKISDIKGLLGHKSFSMVLPKVDLSKTKRIKTYKTIHPMCKDDNGIFN